MHENSYEMFGSTVQWFIKYAYTEKASNRLFSMEVLGRLMMVRAREGSIQVQQNGRQWGRLGEGGSGGRGGRGEAQEGNNKDCQYSPVTCCLPTYMAAVLTSLPW